MSTYTYESIIQEIRTLDDLQLLARQIDALLVALFKPSLESFTDTLNRKLQRTLGTTLILSLRQQNISLDNREQLQIYFNGLRDYIAHLPMLQLIIAYHPSNEQIEQLSDWARAQTGKPVILQLIYNKEILAGAVITYQGRIADLSLKKKLAPVYETKREEILEFLNQNTHIHSEDSERLSVPKNRKISDSDNQTF